MQPSVNPAAGFANPVIESQSAFRAVMNAMARPGSVETLTHALTGPVALQSGVAALVLALADHDTPVWLDAALTANAEVASWLRFHTGAPIVADPAQAAFALVVDGQAMPALDRFALGTDEYPDRSTTLIIGVASLSEGMALELSGPGIRGTSMCRISGLPADIADQLRDNRALFPRGVDLVLVCEQQLIAIPRSARIVVQGA